MTPSKTRLNSIGLTLTAGALSLAGTMASADIVHLDDVIIDGSACIGFDCVNGESFGFDTLRLKENNLRLHFDDTSTSASFPRNDWRLGANDTANGGLNKFFIEDATEGNQPFIIEASAGANALYVDDGGRIGIGTNAPVVDLHVKTGNTPTLRLEQDGTSGFTPQTWDVAGNEANFFVRDATSGSTLPFRIEPGAPTNAIVIDGADGEVGMGTNAPTASLHVRHTDGTASVLVEEANGTTAGRVMMKLKNNGGVFFQLENTVGNTWTVAQENLAPNRFLINSGGTPDFALDTSGNLIIEGTLTTGSSTVYPDYVFQPDYNLMPLAEVEKFIVENGHLPKIPKAEEVAVTGLNISEMQVALLEKVEELTLYTLEQQKTIDALQERLEMLAD